MTDVAPELYARKWGDVEPEPPYPAPQEPAHVVELAACPKGARDLVVSLGEGWVTVGVTRAVGHLPNAQGRPGRLVESYAIRLRGPWVITSEGRTRRAAVVVYLGTHGAAKAPGFHTGWTWTTDDQDRPVEGGPVSANATEVRAWGA